MSFCVSQITYSKEREKEKKKKIPKTSQHIFLVTEQDFVFHISIDNKLYSFFAFLLYVWQHLYCEFIQCIHTLHSIVFKYSIDVKKKLHCEHPTSVRDVSTDCGCVTITHSHTISRRLNAVDCMNLNSNQHSAAHLLAGFWLLVTCFYADQPVKCTMTHTHTDYWNMIFDARFYVSFLDFFFYE